MLDDKMKQRMENWLESLDEEEKMQVEVLDAYFTFRTNLPDVDPGMGKPFEEPKTTDEIVDDLAPMMPMSKSLVASYMRYHDYGFKTVGDGTVKWAVWRYADVTCLT